MENYIDKVKKIADDLAWNVKIDDCNINFQKYASLHQECCFNLEIAETFKEFCDIFYNYYQGFDCSYETYLCLDETGHGKNGAPYEMIDVYNDMKEYERDLYELYKEIESACKGERYIYLNEHTDIITGQTPVDNNDVGNESTAIEYKLPDNFSEKAKKYWEYLEGAAFIYEYEGRLVITDESLELTEYENGAPRWVFNSWEELEEMLEMCYDDYAEDIEEILEPVEKYAFENGVATFMNNEWKVVIALNKLTGFDLQEIYETINPDWVNWNNFEVGEELWYADGSKSIKVKDKNESAKTIWFGK